MNCDICGKKVSEKRVYELTKKKKSIKRGHKNCIAKWAGIRKVEVYIIHCGICGHVMGGNTISRNDSWKMCEQCQVEQTNHAIQEGYLQFGEEE